MKSQRLQPVHGCTMRHMAFRMGPQCALATVLRVSDHVFAIDSNNSSRGSG